MAIYTSKAQVKEELAEAKNNLRLCRSTGEKDKAAFWQKRVNNLQAVLDNWGMK